MSNEDIKTQVEEGLKKYGANVARTAVERHLIHELELSNPKHLEEATTQILSLINEARREGFEEGFKVNEILKLYASRESNE